MPSIEPQIDYVYKDTWQIDNIYLRFIYKYIVRLEKDKKVKFLHLFYIILQNIVTSYNIYES